MKGRRSVIALAVGALSASLQAQTAIDLPTLHLKPALAAGGPGAGTARDPRLWWVQHEGRDLGYWRIRETDGLVYLPESELMRHGLHARPGSELIQAEGATWVAVGDVEGVHAGLDGFSRTIVLEPHKAGRLALYAGMNLRKELVLRAHSREQRRQEAEQTTAVRSQAPPNVRMPRDSTTTAAKAPRMLPLDVRINGADSGPWVLLDIDGVLHATDRALDDWRIQRDTSTRSFAHRGQNWYPLSLVPGYTSKLDFSNQSIDLVFDPKVFAATRLVTEKADRPVLSDPMPAVFVNYDLSHTDTRIDGVTTTNDLGALMEVGVSGSWGYMTSGFVGRNLLRVDPSVPPAWHRLETTFTRDFPQSNLTLRVGDTSTKPGVFGRAQYFGGISLSRNFELSPGFMTQPIPVIAGSSSGPGTVELYINDALRQVSRVPTGPFAIDNFPLLSGTGQAKVVVRDILGRETVVIQPFFSHSDLLEQGLNDWSVEAGKLRRNLGSEDNSYADTLVSGMWRWGVNKSWTLESRTELTESTQLIGVGSSMALPWQALGQVGVSLSHNDSAGQGVLWLLGTEYSHLRHGYSLRVQGASDSYRHVGAEAAAALAYPRQVSASYNYSAGSLGSIGLGVARIDTQTSGSIRTGSINYSVRLGRQASLTVSAAHVSGSSSGRSVGMSLNIPLERQATFSTSTTTKSGVTDGYVSYSQGLTAETGPAWRGLTGTRGGENYAELGLYYHGHKGVLTADISQSSLQNTTRIGAQGGMVLTSRGIFATRTVQEGFAVVEVPGYGGIGVGLQGPNLTRTDSDGVAFVSGLIPYYTNSIRLDASDVPIGAELDNLEQVAVPAARGGVHVVFPVRTGRSALIKIVFDDGEPAPAGADIEVAGDKQTFFVARRGEAFVTGLQNRNELTLKWLGGTCRFQVNLPSGEPQEITRVGPVTCPGLKR